MRLQPHRRIRAARGAGAAHHMATGAKIGTAVVGVVMAASVLLMLYLRCAVRR
jgi:hypothetical protein